MLIRYENTKEDWVAFGDYFLTHSAPGKKSMKRMRWTFPICMFIIGGLLFEGADLKFNFVTAALASIFGFVAMPPLLRAFTARFQRKFIVQNGRKGLVGERSLEITDEGLIERTLYNETKFAWASIHKIESTPNQTYIFTAPFEALIIPHNAIYEGDFRAFLTELKAKYDPNRTLALHPSQIG